MNLLQKELYCFGLTSLKSLSIGKGCVKAKHSKTNPTKNLTKHYLDKLFPLKLQFFKDIAGQLKGFLKAMQINQPMVPFLDESLSDIVLTLMRIIVKPAVLMETNTNYKLIKIDLSNANNLCPCELIKLPTATKVLVVKAELPTLKELQLSERLPSDDCGCFPKNPREIPFEVWHCSLFIFAVSFENHYPEINVQG